MGNHKSQSEHVRTVMGNHSHKNEHNPQEILMRGHHSQGGSAENFEPHYKKGGCTRHRAFQGGMMGNPNVLGGPSNGLGNQLGMGKGNYGYGPGQIVTFGQGQQNRGPVNGGPLGPHNNGLKKGGHAHCKKAEGGELKRAMGGAGKVRKGMMTEKGHMR